MKFAVWVSKKSGKRWVEALGADDAVRMYAQELAESGDLPPGLDDVELEIVVAWKLPSGEIDGARYTVRFTRSLRWETKQPELPA